MTRQTELKSPTECIGHIAALFRESPLKNNGFFHNTVHLSVREDISFGDAWLELGEVLLHPAPQERDEEEHAPTENAVALGFYDWKMKTFEELLSNCLILLGHKESQDTKKNGAIENKAKRSLDSIIDVSRRMGMLFPRIDADILSSAPFRRPTTVVSDTSAIGQGGVDFLIQFLSPMARLKIPSLVTMEILNQSDRFLSMRRKLLSDNKPNEKKKADLLFEHVVSQSNQRAMLRFELHSDIEIERTPLLSDPLRSAFTSDREHTDWNDLNLSAPVRSFCDRLIMETVRQHLAVVSPGHPVMLMTGDEGLARMALAEGIQPFFLHAAKTSDLYGQVLTGTRFHPFSGKLFSIPLQCLLWEFAVTFGNARLSNQDGSVFFEVCAMDQGMNWQPFHAKDDLLRVSWNGLSDDNNRTPSAELSSIQEPTQDSSQLVKEKRALPKPKGRKAHKPSTRRAKLGPFKESTVYRFDLNLLMQFIPFLLQKGSVPVDGKGTPLARNTRRTLSKYLGFLATGGFISEDSVGIKPTDSLQRLWDFIISRDYDGIFESFRSVPSLGVFLEALEIKSPIVVFANAPENERPSYTYVQIAEICGRALPIPLDAIYGTFKNPSASGFVDCAMQAYESNVKGDEYILTGQWLETLAIKHGVHPVIARERLAEAHAAGLIERYTQGSTPDTRFEKHVITVLQLDSGRATTAKVNLYHGDFILPGKSSVRIRLERK